MDEIARIAMLARTFARDAPGVEIGIGDDAAVLAPPPAGARLVWTIDEQIEGTHFERALLSWRDVGWRSFMAAASDVAAMGAAPWCALCALGLPDDVDDAALAEIARGQREAAEAVCAPIVGGNLSRGPALSIATTLLGMCDVGVQRRGGRPGDALWMAGKVGFAAAGLRALQRRIVGDARLDAAIAAWRTPRALIAEGRAMAEVAHAAIDVSDGLARDAGHLAKASGVRVVLYESELLADSGLIDVAAALGENAVDLALHGGEDYALVVASDVAITGFQRIGELGEGTGVFLRDSKSERAIEPRGFDHFAARISVKHER